MRAHCIALSSYLASEIGCSRTEDECKQSSEEIEVTRPVGYLQLV